MAPLKKIDALKDLSSADQLIYGKIDVSGLLNLVRDHPLLYRVAHPDHKSNSRKDSAWAAIGEELAIDGALLKFKFKQLMAVYRKEKSKTKRASGSGAVSVKVWQYAAEMAFVDNKDSTRESTGNLTRTSIENDPPTVASLTTTIDSSDDPNDDPLALPPGLPDDQFSTSFDSSYLEAGKRAHGDFEEYTFDKPKSKKIKMSKSDQFCQLIESIEERKIKAITTVNEQDQDADRLFVLSLLPYLKQLNQYQKMTFRSEVQNLLLSKMTFPEY